MFSAFPAANLVLVGCCALLALLPICEILAAVTVYAICVLSAAMSFSRWVDNSSDLAPQMDGAVVAMSQSWHCGLSSLSACSSTTSQWMWVAAFTGGSGGCVFVCVCVLQETAKEWGIMFYTTASLKLVCFGILDLLASGQVQPCTASEEQELLCPRDDISGHMSLWRPQWIRSCDDIIEWILWRHQYRVLLVTSLLNRSGDGIIPWRTAREVVSLIGSHLQPGQHSQRTPTQFRVHYCLRKQPSVPVLCRRNVIPYRGNFAPRFTDISIVPRSSCSSCSTHITLKKSLANYIQLELFVLVELTKTRKRGICCMYQYPQLHFVAKFFTGQSLHISV